MKKIMMLATTLLLAIGVNAAAVNWTVISGDAKYANNAYQFFIVDNANDVTVSSITALLDAGTNPIAKAFGSGNLGANGAATVSGSGKTIDAGSYTSFVVLFDGATPEAAKNYALFSGAATQNQSPSPTAANVTFGTGNMKTFLANPENWKSYGDVPEPTSGLLLIVGGALLALRRKQK